ncbi:hypothetical protein Q428_03115 [Fervidicella metallireducens AeB]|uniref:PPM-type phosphatase domain-containing protein n=1 Tax=Fervidicella metallireducens AeB TaxID=1403537 RepID=A0A017RXZ2_9CLOT|nr:Stp1/IreP family PP2C-type Ser/Thr phosphatase [Fervidicella metallireducens]EYE89279.1 hypothetical protein Q428_03115 [Fervidicella metallireducens AeB]
MRIKCKTDKGMVRESNQDYILTLKGKNYVLLITADGMGGHKAGEIASKIASISIRDFIFKNFSLYIDTEELIRDAIISSNKIVFNKSTEDNSLNGMGTTITCCLIKGDKLYLGHVGDSRAYIVNEKGITKITQDHSFVQELIDNGSITENEALRHPQRNLITRAIGTDKHVVVDTKIENIMENDLIILCTDGLTTYVSSEEIFEIVKEKKEDAVFELIDLANSRGGSDNISVIIARKEDEK